MLTRLETKVWAGAAGFLGGGQVGVFLVWLLGVLVWHAPNTADQADTAIRAVPWPAAELVPLFLAALTGVTAAYKAPASNHAGNNPTGQPMDDTAAGHDPVPVLGNEIDQP